MIKQVQIRHETSSDYPEITKINDLAFLRPNEGLLIHDLRNLDSFDPKLSLVAVKDKALVGHILLFPIFIQAKDATYPSLSLGPIAVHPDHQNRGIGGRLILEAHKNALRRGYTSVILLGHPGYYPRFGYRMAAIWGLTNPWGIHNEAFMAIELVEGSLFGKAGLAQYPGAFNQAT